VGGKC
jgi:hypothetical protein